MIAPTVAPPHPDDTHATYESVAPHPPEHDTTGRVYVAYPLTIHKTPRGCRLLRLARRRFPRAEVLPACDLYESNADWLHRWPAILPTLAAVCVVTDGRGWVGYGVCTEVRDARAAGVPVYLLTDEALHPWEAVEIAQRNPDDWRRYARLRVPKPERGTGNG